MAHLDEAGHLVVSDAVAAAERGTDGEIVTVVAGRSDEYHDVAAQWASAVSFGAIGLLAVFPGTVERLHHLFVGDWTGAPGARTVLTIALLGGVVGWLVAYLALRWRPFRIALTPPATRTRRVRRRALQLFRTAAEARTRGHTGVLLYLSLAEHRAELIADAAIHARVAPDVWGEAMAALLDGVRDDRIADGMAAAVAQVGVVLTEHFPRSDGDTNELPDRLIEL